MTRAADAHTTATGRVLGLDLPGGRVDLSLDHSLAPLADELAVLWSHLLVDQEGTDGQAPMAVLHYGSTSAEGVTVLDAEDPRACYRISGQVTRTVIGALLGRRLLLHAGAVLLEGTGTTVLLGGSGAGKSTAATALGRQGHYLSDELTIIDPDDLTVTAYPKPVSRVVRGRIKQDLALPDLGLDPICAAGPVDTIVLLDRGGAQGEASLKRVELVEAASLIAAQSSSLWRLPDPLGTIARMLDRVGGALQARYDESAALTDLLAAPPARRNDPWETISPADPVQQPGPPDVAGAGHVAVPFVQALRSEIATLVLQEGSTAALTGLAELAWDLVREHGPIDTAGLERRVIEAVGEHPGSAELVATALGTLQEAGLITRA